MEWTTDGGGVLKRTDVVLIDVESKVRESNRRILK